MTTELAVRRKRKIQCVDKLLKFSFPKILFWIRKIQSWKANKLWYKIDGSTHYQNIAYSGSSFTQHSATGRRSWPDGFTPSLIHLFRNATSNFLTCKSNVFRIIKIKMTSSRISSIILFALSRMSWYTNLL